MPLGLSLHVVPASMALPSIKHEILQLCNAAYGEDLTGYFDVLTPDHHVLAKLDNQLVGYAMTITRWLQCGGGPLLQTAYVELVATRPGYRGLGIATSVMQRLEALVAEMEYDLAALCPANTGLYRHLGWEDWLGPLFIREREPGANEDNTLIPTPEERVMILRLPGSPYLAINEALSAEWRAGGELW